MSSTPAGVTLDGEPSCFGLEQGTFLFASPVIIPAGSTLTMHDDIRQALGLDAAHIQRLQAGGPAIVQNGLALCVLQTAPVGEVVGFDPRNIPGAE